MILAKEARLAMEKKQLIGTDRMNRILTPIDKYAKVVDVAIQHSPEITYVYDHRPLSTEEVLTCGLKFTGLGWGQKCNYKQK